ncbi:uncharacterized protein LOC107834285 [Poecilia formosa]|uniref:uncharacterized protein LOC107834285 n=1 Tax=Poecilia formosa TaxID=48698 RepID=UPI0007B9A232|nr:PREDICTED: uncharacterized protein LOC107834285 [Poecilia formosa]
MSFVSQPRSNISVEFDDVGLLERVITFTLCTIPSCVFLFINGTILFTLRSKSVLRDTCRYILLFNLLLSDTAQLVISQVVNGDSKLFQTVAEKFSFTARSASTGKASALKARNTLVLHLVQLCLSLSSTIYNPMLIALIKIVQTVVFLRLHKFLYVLIILFPKCLSSLIYGLRDQTIRPILLSLLGCHLKHKAVAVSCSKFSFCQGLHNCEKN